MIKKDTAFRIQEVKHTFLPVFDENSKVLILGTMPSPKSRELGFYYGHPRNRFWKVISDVCGEELPESVEDKIAFALQNKIAVWDVLASCEIKGASDGSIRNPVANDMNIILRKADIKAVFTTGSKASTLYQRYCFPQTNIPAVKLPSTSPANCRTTYEELFAAYEVILKYIR